MAEKKSTESYPVGAIWLCFSCLVLAGGLFVMPGPRFSRDPVIEGSLSLVLAAAEVTIALYVAIRKFR